MLHPLHSSVATTPSRSLRFHASPLTTTRNNSTTPSQNPTSNPWPHAPPVRRPHSTRPPFASEDTLAPFADLAVNLLRSCNLSPASISHPGSGHSSPSYYPSGHPSPISMPRRPASPRSPPTRSPSPARTILVEAPIDVPSDSEGHAPSLSGNASFHAPPMPAVPSPPASSLPSGLASSPHTPASVLPRNLAAVHTPHASLHTSPSLLSASNTEAHVHSTSPNRVSPRDHSGLTQ